MSDTEQDTGPAAAAAEPRKIVRRMKRRVFKRQSAPRAEVQRAAPVAAAQRGTAASVAVAQDEAAEPVRRISRTERDNRAIDIPASSKKPGWDYAWWVITVRGQPAADLAPHYHAASAHDGGWRPQKNKDWPGIAGPGSDPEGVVTQGGAILVARPMHLTQEAREEDQQFASRMQRDRVMGTLDGKVHNDQGLADIPGVRVRREGKDMGLEMEVRIGSNT